MSADFFAGYLSGAVSIIIGNPLDVLKVRLQASQTSPQPASPSSSRQASVLSQPRNFLLGTAAPILSYGALNALLFVSYNRSETFLNSFFFGSQQRSPSPPSPSPSSSPPGQGQQGQQEQQQQQQQKGSNLATTFLAGCASGIATFVISCPTEIVKVRSQTSSLSSLSITKQILSQHGIRGLYQAGGVTVLRDAIGYGFYFLAYEYSSRFYNKYFHGTGKGRGETTTGRALVCGGVAGVATWVSIFPLDVLKTRLQTLGTGTGTGTGEGGGREKKGAWELGREMYRREGGRVFFRGLGVCSLRAFVVNAVQFAVYEGLMAELTSPSEEVVRDGGGGMYM
ncbi:putative mitochondrial ornithine transporter [Triangularia verruculosa]|uniref:Mitochondrial ornithine transporter n=1 Tax=Triangularia verruculosa TaxID=2587418 RepID=A0AAN7AR06_9PEZI|nr:putative mitochondrial ornithine transporter [Triangularia verruculosa]